MVPFESLCTVSYSHSVATMGESLAVSTEYTNATDTEPDRRRTAARAGQCSHARLKSRGIKLPILGYKVNY